jgi:hypothetical protein
MYAISSVRRFLLLCSFLDSGIRVLIEAAKIPAFSYLLFAHFDAAFPGKSYFGRRFAANTAHEGKQHHGKPP